MFYGSMFYSSLYGVLNKLSGLVSVYVYSHYYIHWHTYNAKQYNKTLSILFSKSWFYKTLERVGPALPTCCRFLFQTFRLLCRLCRKFEWFRWRGILLLHLHLFHCSSILIWNAKRFYHSEIKKKLGWTHWGRRWIQSNRVWLSVSS